jgi:hypothetical protein
MRTGLFPRLIELAEYIDVNILSTRKYLLNPDPPNLIILTIEF